MLNCVYYAPHAHAFIDLVCSFVVITRLLLSVPGVELFLSVPGSIFGLQVASPLFNSFATALCHGGYKVRLIYWYHGYTIIKMVNEINVKILTLLQAIARSVKLRSKDVDTLAEELPYTTSIR